MNKMEMLNDWMSESSQNFNVIIALIIILHVGSVAVFLYVSKKFGEKDERTNGIYRKVCTLMFSTQLITNALFIYFVDSDIEHFRQLFMLLEGFVFLVGAIYSVRLYRKDLK